jgi:GDP-mannose 6-dehydrogenase
VADSDISLICVGTPPQRSGAPDLRYVLRVCEEIGAAVRDKGREHVVVLRSTVAPDTTSRCREILTQTCGDLPVHVAFNPEFLREGCAVKDFDEPPYTIIGTDDAAAERALRELYAAVKAEVVVVDPAAAELLKWVANAWHATKVSFANEVGRVAKASGVDGREVMGLIVRDHKLNVSPVYMRPGFAYGGSCLTKDVAALLAHGGQLGLHLPLVRSLARSNAAHVDAAVAMVLALRPYRLGVLGLSFKPGTDDLRESPAVPLVERLLSEGCAVRIYDRNVRQGLLRGTNSAYIREHLPRFEALLVDSPAEVVSWASVVVVTHASGEFATALRDAPESITVVDLAGIEISPNGGRSHGIAW